MKTLIIMSIVLGVFFLYFVATAEKPSVVKGGELTPRGIDVPKVALDGAKALKAMIMGDTAPPTGENVQAVGDRITEDSVPILINKIKNTAKDAVSKTIEKAKEIVGDPIEQKISEVFCPAK